MSAAAFEGENGRVDVRFVRERQASIARLACESRVYGDSNAGAYAAARYYQKWKDERCCNDKKNQDGPVLGTSGTCCGAVCAAGVAYGGDRQNAEGDTGADATAARRGRHWSGRYGYWQRGWRDV